MPVHLRYRRDPQTIIAAPLRTDQTMNTSTKLLFLLLAAVSTTGVQCFFSSAGAPTKVASSNTIPDKQILALAEDYVTNKNGFYAPIDADAHSDEFIFRGGVVGPLNKADYCTTMTKLGISKAFDLTPNSFGFCVDPDIKNACRFYVRYTGRQVKNWKVAGTPIDIPIPENDRAITGPTESFCIQFDDEGKAKFFTISAPMPFGNPTQSTTGGVGAVLGLFKHVGLDIAADSAMNANVRSISNAVANVLPENVAPPKTASKSEELPTWWKGY